MISVRLVSTIFIYIIGLLACLYASVIYPITATEATVEALASASLTMGSILIAVLGVLLAMFVSQNLKNTVYGSSFKLLFVLVSLGMAVSFLCGVTSLYGATKFNDAHLVFFEWSTLIIAVYTTAFGAVASVVMILL